jgi:hypothetical protein
MFGQCMSLVSSCLYGEGEWTSTPEVPASQPIPGTNKSAGTGTGIFFLICCFLEIQCRYYWAVMKTYR